MLRIATSLLLLVSVMAPDALAAVNDVTLGTSPTADITDWSDEYCVDEGDPAVCDEFPNQQDGKGACIASNYSAPGPADTAFMRYDFDDTGRMGNTMNGCWLVDVNQNGNADRAFCFSISSTGGTASGVTARLFTCTDGSSSGCSGSSEVMGSSAACAINNDVPDENQLTDCAIGDKDLAVECSSSLIDMGWSSGQIGLLWGCSSTSAEPISQTFDCVGDSSAPLYINPETGENYPVELQYFEIE